MRVEYLAAGYGICDASLYGDSQLIDKGKSNVAHLAQEEMHQLGVVIVDMQKPFLQKIERKKRKEIIAHQKRVLERCSQYDIPVIRLQFRGRGETIRELERNLLQLSRSEKHWKDYDAGFRGSASRLKEWGVKYVFFMGVNAGGCVLANAEVAVSGGFYVFTSEEVIAQPSDWSSNSFIGYRRWFGDHGRLYLDSQSYLEKGRIYKVKLSENDYITRAAWKLLC